MEIILGVAVSLVVQLIKKYLGTNTLGTLASVLVLSIVASVGYNFLVASGLWESILPILTMAGAFYTFVISRFED